MLMTVLGVTVICSQTQKHIPPNGMYTLKDWKQKNNKTIQIGPYE